MTADAPIENLRQTLEFIALRLIDYPEQAQLKVAELEDGRISLRLVVKKEDVAILIGRNGFTASSIRGILKAFTEKTGVEFTLRIHSIEEEELRMVG